MLNAAHKAFYQQSLGKNRAILVPPPFFSLNRLREIGTRNQGFPYCCKFLYGFTIRVYNHNFLLFHNKKGVHNG